VLLHEGIARDVQILGERDEPSRKTHRTVVGSMEAGSKPEFEKAK
jgi:hypothetical protein